MREQLSDACTAEIAAFDDFVGLLAGDAASYEHVVFDTAPTGYNLLLMAATGAYHRQVVQTQAQSIGGGSTHFVTPLMHLQDPSYTRSLLVTLPETTPVSEAAALQSDLRDPLLRARVRVKQAQFTRVLGGLAQRCYVPPCQAGPPVGLPALRALAPVDK